MRGLWGRMLKQSLVIVAAVIVLVVEACRPGRCNRPDGPRPAGKAGPNYQDVLTLETTTKMTLPSFSLISIFGTLSVKPSVTTTASV